MSAVLLVGLLAGPTVGQIDPNGLPGWQNEIVKHIQVSNLSGTFDTSWPNSLGLLEISPRYGGPVVTVYYETAAPWSLSPDDGNDVEVWVTLSLVKDRSGGGLAEGNFDGEGVGDPDWRIRWENISALAGADLTLLEGTLGGFLLQEYMGTGMLAGSGRITTTGGLLADLDMWPDGQFNSLTSFEFSIIDPTTGQPLNIGDFSQDFTGEVYLTFYPEDNEIPEPTMWMLLLGGGSGWALRRRRR